MVSVYTSFNFVKCYSMDPCFSYFILGLFENSLSTAGDISMAARVWHVAAGSEGRVGPVLVLLSPAALQLEFTIIIDLKISLDFVKN